jgi:MHS family alpha-ketoglutarate permease-like MFS transporter
MATTSTTRGDDHLDQVHDLQRRLKAIFIGSVGNLVEWYDFYAYAAFALYSQARSSRGKTRWCSS